MPELSEWESFYVIVGSSAGALIGLQFVVLTLIAEMPFRPGMERAFDAFASPTIIHFGSVLLLSGVLSAPWHRLAGVAAIWGLLGLSGIIYTIVVGRRMFSQSLYKPVFEDHMFHLVLPLIAYGVMAGSALVAHAHERAALFSIAAAALLLLFIGIHNAWDAVTYNVFEMRRREHEKKS